MKADALTKLTCSQIQRRLLLYDITPYDVEQFEQEDDYDDFCSYSCAYFSNFSTELGFPLI